MSDKWDLINKLIQILREKHQLKKDVDFGIMSAGSAVHIVTNIDNSVKIIDELNVLGLDDHTRFYFID